VAPKSPIPPELRAGPTQEVEVRPDPDALARYERGMLLTLAVFFLSLPAFGLTAALVVAALGREAAGRALGPALLAALFAIPAALLWTSRDLLAYRCPACRRRLPRVTPAGEREFNFLYLCNACGIAWDLGWGPREED
jgi:hypothetical protein